VLGLAVSATALEFEGTDVATLNDQIGRDYEAEVSSDDLVERALDSRLVLYGEVHDQAEAPRQFLRLATALQSRSQAPLRLGVEFVDRGDWDILARYLDRSLDEDAFLARLMPTSLLLLPEVGPAHLEILRYARRNGIDVLPLESRPGGARPMVLRNAEIRWNLANHLGRHATERLLVLYGVQHVVGPDAVSHGLQVPLLTVTSYGDSVLEKYAQRTGKHPEAGTVLRLPTGVYLQAVGGAPRPAVLPAWDPGAREPLLVAIEASYAGDWHGLPLVIEALGDEDVRWRRAAIHALRQAAERSFGYDPEAEPAARQAAQDLWSDWWSRNEKRVGAR
jgi:hypothetical protein